MRARGRAANRRPNARVLFCACGHPEGGHTRTTQPFAGLFIHNACSRCGCGRFFPALWLRLVKLK